MLKDVIEEVKELKAEVQNEKINDQNDDNEEPPVKVIEYGPPYDSENKDESISK